MNRVRPPSLPEIRSFRLRAGSTAIAPDLQRSARTEPLDAAIIEWAKDGTRLASSQPVPIVTVWPELHDAVPAGVTLQCLPEVELDRADFNRHPQMAELMKRLKEWLRSLDKPESRASMASMTRHRRSLDLSDLKRHPINIAGGGTGEDKPFRVVFREDAPSSEPPTITVVAIGRKVGKDDEVYERKVSRRWGREATVRRTDGYWLELRLIADHNERSQLASDLFRDSVETLPRAWATSAWWPAGVTLMSRDCEDFSRREPAWVTDMLTLSCDYDFGRHMLRTVGEICSELRRRRIRHELGF
jgi:hypothetical protein